MEGVRFMPSGVVYFLLIVWTYCAPNSFELEKLFQSVWLDRLPSPWGSNARLFRAELNPIWLINCCCFFVFHQLVPALVLFRVRRPPLFFSLALSGFARSGPGVLVWVFAPSLFFCVPLLGFRLSNLSSHFHFHLIFIPLFILIFTSLHANHPASGRVCVRVKRLNIRKTSPPLHYIILYIYIIICIILQQGITGVPGGSVINEDTSPGPV